MSFQQDVENTPGLDAAYCRGLQALHETDRQRLNANPPRKLAGSANIDHALREQFPNSPRWDYVVAWTATNASEHLHWIEVHSANGSGKINEMSVKLTWLIGWLSGDGSRLRGYPRKLVWIASGSTGFRAGSPQSKKIASMGILFVGNHYTIKD
jgi:hypothetical protein